MYDPDHLIYLGDAIKALDDKGKIGGYLIRFGSEAEPDLQGDFFTKATDCGLDYIKGAPIYYHHCKDFSPGSPGAKSLGMVSLKADDVGIWAEGVLDKADRYEKTILSMVKAGKLRWSSGTAPNVVLRTSVKGVNRIDRWPIVDATLTATPVEFRGTGVMPMKALDNFMKGEHLGDVEHAMARSAMQSLHYGMMDRVAQHMADPKKTKPQKLKACKGCLDEHHEAAMKCLKSMMPDDDDGGDSDDGDDAMKARRLKLESLLRP